MSGDRQHPVIESMNARFVRAYADMLARVNTSIVTALKNRRGVHKSSARFIVAPRNTLVTDLFKAKNIKKLKAPAAKAPKVKTLKPKTPASKPRDKEDRKVKAPGSRGGHFYRDSHGNIRYGTKPSHQFHTKLKPEEENKVHEHLHLAIQEMPQSDIKKLVDVFDVDEDVIDTLRDSVATAQAQGLDPAQNFAEDYALAVSDEDDENGEPKAKPEDIEEGLTIYKQMVSDFQEAVKSPEWIKSSKKSLTLQKRDSVIATDQVARQKKVVAGHFDAMMSGDVTYEAIKSLAIIHDLGLLKIFDVYMASQAADEDPNAKKMVGEARLETTRATNLSRFGDTLLPEQQVALIASVFADQAQDQYDEDLDYDRDAFWKAAKDDGAVDQLRTWLEDSGKKYTDAQWNRVADRVITLSREVSKTLEQYNNNTGGSVFKALYHRSVDLTKIFKSKDVLKELADVDALNAKVREDAVAAQDKTDHPIDPQIEKALKANFGPKGTLFPYQRSAIAWMTTVKRGILAYDAGLGKACRDDTPVATPEGFVRLDSLKIGDYVMSPSGKPVRVSGVYPQGLKKNYRITFSDSVSTNSCDEHLWHVMPASTGSSRTHEVLDLMEIMRRGLYTDTGEIRFKIPITKPIEYATREQSIPAYTLGVLLSNGQFAQNAQIFQAQTNDVVQRVARELFRSTQINVLTNRENSFSLTHDQGGKKSTYAIELRALNLSDCRDKNKFIPETYRYGDIEQRIALLQGLCDSTGFIPENSATVGYHTHSERLCDHFVELVQSLGGLATNSTHHNEEFKYLVTFDVPTTIIPFSREDLRKRFLERRIKAAPTPELMRSIVEIKQQEHAPSRCIKVENADGLYLTEHYVVTHNTPIAIATASQLIAEGKIKRGILVLPASLVAQWPKEIEKYRPGSKVQVIDVDSGSLEDRLLMINAINNGEIDADFVVMSASCITSTAETEAKIDELVRERGELTGKKVTAPERAEIIKENKLYEDDPFVSALRNLDGMMIFDEAHSGSQALRNPHNISRMIAEEALQNREYAFGMTATPMAKDPGDLFHLSNLFNPGSAGESLSRFQNRLITYDTQIDPTTGKETKVPVDLDMQDLLEAKKMIKPYVFLQRKSQKNVADAIAASGNPLPPINASSHTLALDGPGRDLYIQAGTEGFDNPGANQKTPLYGFKEGHKTDVEMRKYLEKKYGAKTTERVMKNRLLNRMTAATISPKLIDKNYKGPQPKIDRAIEITQRHFADPKNANSPVVVFANLKDALRLMKEEYVKAGIPEELIGQIDGDYDQGHRDAVQSAVNEGKLKVVLIGIEAGGAGLNLQEKAFTSIYLEKPPTPASLEQSVGRTWRIGQKHKCEIHHMKILGSTDQRRYDVIERRADLIDALSFCDLGNDYLSKTQEETKLRLIGSFDHTKGDADTPAELKDLWSAAGLGKAPNKFKDIKAMKEKFDIKKYRDTIEHGKWEEVGDYRIKNMSTINDIKYKAGQYDEKKWLKNRRAISRKAGEWMKLVGASMDHPVAVYTGNEFTFGSEADNSISAPNKGIQKGGKRTKIVAVKPAKTKPVKPSGPLKVHPKSTFTLKNVSKNPYSQSSGMWAFWEGLRRTRPKGYQDAVGKVANWMAAYSKGSDNQMTRAEALDLVKDFFKNENVLQKLQKKGLIEVTS